MHKLQRSYEPDIRIQFEKYMTWGCGLLSSLEKAIKCAHLMEASVDTLRQSKICIKLIQVNRCMKLQDYLSMFAAIIITAHVNKDQLPVYSYPHPVTCAITQNYFQVKQSTHTSAYLTSEQTGDGENEYRGTDWNNTLSTRNQKHHSYLKHTTCGYPRRKPSTTPASRVTELQKDGGVMKHH